MCVCGVCVCVACVIEIALRLLSLAVAVMGGGEDGAGGWGLCRIRAGAALVAVVSRVRLRGRSSYLCKGHDNTAQECSRCQIWLLMLMENITSGIAGLGITFTYIYTYIYLHVEDHLMFPTDH